MAHAADDVAGIAVMVESALRCPARRHSRWCPQTPVRPGGPRLLLQLALPPGRRRTSWCSFGFHFCARLLPAASRRRWRTAAVTMAWPWSRWPGARFASERHVVRFARAAAHTWARRRTRPQRIAHSGDSRDTDRQRQHYLAGNKGSCDCCCRAGPGSELFRPAAAPAVAAMLAALLIAPSLASKPRRAANS